MRVETDSDRRRTALLLFALMDFGGVPAEARDRHFDVLAYVVWMLDEFDRRVVPIEDVALAMDLPEVAVRASFAEFSARGIVERSRAIDQKSWLFRLNGDHWKERLFRCAATN